MPRDRDSRPRDDRAADPARRRRRWPRITAWTVGGVLLVAVVGGVVLAFQARSVWSDLTQAKKDLSSVMKDVDKGDTAAVEATAHKAQERASRANATVSNPLWAIASVIPFAGPNVDGVRRATQATYDLVDGALPPGLKILGALQQDKGSTEGGIDLEPLREAESSLPAINEAFASAHERVEGIDRDRLLPAVDDAIGSLIDVIEKATPALANVEKYLPTILDIAGAEGPRTYMIIFQNNAEVRSGGGLPAATAIIDVNDGKTTLADQTSTYSFRRDLKVIDPPEAMQALYPSDTFTGFGNFTRTPNFPTTAEAFDSLWNITTGQHLDGVVTVDPVVLSHILSVTGPVTASDGTVLTSGNVVKTLLYDTYQRYAGSQQDLFFGDVAARVFTKVAAGKWDVLKMLDQLERSVDEQRLHLWFPVAAEQSMVTDLGLDGALPTSNKTSTEVGIFLNDFAASKLEYFMKTKVAVTCDAQARTVTTSVTITNDVPMDGMTNYQLGIRNQGYGIPRQSFILDVMYFAPPGSEITAVAPAADDASATRTGVERDRDVQSTRYFVASGTTKTVSYTSTLPSGPLGPLSVRYSPTVTETPVSISDTCTALFPAS